LYGCDYAGITGTGCDSFVFVVFINWSFVVSLFISLFTVKRKEKSATWLTRGVCVYAGHNKNNKNCHLG